MVFIYDKELFQDKYMLNQNTFSTTAIKYNVRYVRDNVTHT